MAHPHVLEYQLTGVGGGAYAADDVVGVGSIALRGAASRSRPWGFIDSVQLIEAGSVQAAATDILFFKRAITVPTNNSAFLPGKADWFQYCGVVSFLAGDWIKNASGTNGAVATKPGIGISFELDRMPYTGILYAVWVTRGTPTYPDPTGLMIKVGTLPTLRVEA